MPAPALPLASGDDTGLRDTVFARIAVDLEARGYSVQPAALPGALAATLHRYAVALPRREFHPAGIGRGDDYARNAFVRTDDICWITGDDAPCAAWLDWCDALREYLNRRLFLGLFSFESHFAHYAPGDYYRRHYDAFRGEANRVLSVVAYLNPGWSAADGGELLLYRDGGDREGLRVLPLLGSLAVFLSEDFPHEVLAARRDRYSIAGWYRRNGSRFSRVDPPR